MPFQIFALHHRPGEFGNEPPYKVLVSVADPYDSEYTAHQELQQIIAGTHKWSAANKNYDEFVIMEVFTR